MIHKMDVNFDVLILKHLFPVWEGWESALLRIKTKTTYLSNVVETTSPDCGKM